MIAKITNISVIPNFIEPKNPLTILLPLTGLMQELSVCLNPGGQDATHSVEIAVDKEGQSAKHWPLLAVKFFGHVAPT